MRKQENGFFLSGLAFFFLGLKFGVCVSKLSVVECWFDCYKVHSHAHSIRSHRGTEVLFQDFQPMGVSEELVCIYLFRQNPVVTSLHLRSPVHVVPPLMIVGCVGVTVVVWFLFVTDCWVSCRVLTVVCWVSLLLVAVGA